MGRSGKQKTHDKSYYARHNVTIHKISGFSAHKAREANSIIDFKEFLWELL